MKVVFGILFFTFIDADIKFVDKKLIYKTYDTKMLYHCDLGHLPNLVTNWEILAIKPSTVLLYGDTNIYKLQITF